MERTILHCDMNNFFASVECIGHSEYKERPVAVCGDPTRRQGIILAKNECAKRYGVQTGEMIAAAKRKCPSLLLLPSHYEKYTTCSEIAREIYRSYTDRVESFGTDECWLDVTTQGYTPEAGKKLADELRQRIRKETGLTISAGVSFNKVFAKMGSDYKKPDATTVITRGNFKELLWKLPLSEMMFAGKATIGRMELYGIRRIGDLALADTELLLTRFGKPGVQLQLFAQGKDASPVQRSDEVEPPKSISNGLTTPRNLTCEEDVKILLAILCDSVSARLRGWKQKCTRVTAEFRTDRFRNLHSGSAIERTCLGSVLFQHCLRLYHQCVPFGTPLRSITVSAEQLSPMESEQLSFLDDSMQNARREELADMVDRLRDKYGKCILRPALTLLSPELSDLSPAKNIFKQNGNERRNGTFSVGNQMTR